MNITITQDNSRIEVLGSNGASIIEKLYELAIDPNNTLTLEGNISSTGAYGYQVDYLNTNYGPDFIVNATDRYIHFEDPNMESYLASMNIGTNGKVTEAQAAAVTTIANAPNSTITKFNELRYFTNITESKGGFNSANTGACSFYNWTALEEVDISNFTSLGHDSTYGWNDTFRSCTALKKVIASNKLTQLGCHAFNGCSNLEEVSGLSGQITICAGAFTNCAKLTDDTFENCTSIVFLNGADGALQNCSLLTTLPPFSGSLSRTFANCSNLEIDLTNLNGITHIGPETFNSTKKTEGVVNLPNLDSGDLGYRAFKNTKISKVLSLGSCGKLQEEAFSGCTDLTEVDLSSHSMVIGTSVFENCSSLQSINVETVTGLAKNAFAGCSQLELLYFKELLHPDSQSNTLLSNGLFTGGGLFIYAPKLQDINGGFDQGGNNVRGLFVTAGYQSTITDKNIIYFKDLSSVETGAFCGGNVKHLIINNTTPPTVTAYQDKKQNLLIDVSGNGVSRSVVQNVWVPDSAVNTYKADTYWGEFGNKIQGLSGLSKVATRVLWDQLSASAKADTLIEEYM